MYLILFASSFRLEIPMSCDSARNFFQVEDRSFMRSAKNNSLGLGIHFGILGFITLKDVYLLATSEDIILGFTFHNKKV